MANKKLTLIDKQSIYGMKIPKNYINSIDEWRDIHILDLDKKPYNFIKNNGKVPSSAIPMYNPVGISVTGVVNLNMLFYLSNPFPDDSIAVTWADNSDGANALPNDLATFGLKNLTTDVDLGIIVSVERQNGIDTLNSIFGVDYFMGDVYEVYDFMFIRQSNGLKSAPVSAQFTVPSSDAPRFDSLVYKFDSTSWRFDMA